MGTTTCLYFPEHVVSWATGGVLRRVCCVWLFWCSLGYFCVSLAFRLVDWVDGECWLVVPLFGLSVCCLVGWLVGWSSCWVFVLQGTLFGRFVRLFGWLFCCSVCSQSACIFLGRHFGPFLRPSGDVLNLYIAFPTLSALHYLSVKWGKYLYFIPIMESVQVLI